MLADIILIALILLNVLIGLKRGFIQTIGNLVALVLSLAISLLLVGPLAGILEKASFMAPVKDKVTGWVLGPLEKTAATIGEAIRGMKLPPFLAELMQSGLPAAESSVGKAQDAMAGALFHFAVSAAVFIVLLILVSLVIYLVGRSLTKLSDSVPVLGTLNRIAGMAAGLVLGAAEVFILLLVLGFAAPYIPAVAAAIDQSFIAKIFYSSNFLFFLL